MNKVTGALLIVFVCSISVVIVFTSCVRASNDAHNSSMNMTMMKMMERGNITMGFNQNKIAHRFLGTPTGGEIIITALNNSDKETINQINNHVLTIKKEFSEANFTRPFFMHALVVPGSEVMSQKKDSIKYDILKRQNGSTLLLTTSDKQLIVAINQFMEFQAIEHRGH